MNNTKSKTPPSSRIYRVGLRGSPTAGCVVDDTTHKLLTHDSCEIIDDYATLPDGYRILDLVFEAHGLGSYIEQARAGNVSLALLDGNPLNCHVDNITINNLSPNA